MTDNQKSLAKFVQSGSDAAFRVLVARYVDLVYSTALRRVGGNPHQAEDVAQTVFMDLARAARTLPKDIRLGGWLHRHTCFVAANTLRGERRRQSRERQAAEMNALENKSDPEFTQLAPLLDEVINELGDVDRTAILLRFFEQHDFRAIGEALDCNEDAARMRVNRALEKLEGLLKRRGLTSSAAALSLALSANAVQAAPVGLALTISAAALTGTTLATTATVTATKAIAMTALQKTIVTATIAVLAGVGIYEARQASQLRAQVQTLQQQQAPLIDEIEHLKRQRDEAASRSALLAEENANLKKGSTELLRLRGEVALLRTELQSLKPNAGNDSAESTAKSWLDRVKQLKEYIDQNPNETVPESQFLTDREWLVVAADAWLKTDKFETADEYRRATETLRSQAQSIMGNQIQAALRKYAAANNGQFPADLSQLQPYCEPVVANLLLSLYEIRKSDIFPAALRKEYGIKGDWIVTRKTGVNPNSPSRLAIHTDGSAYWQTDWRLNATDDGS